MFFIRTLISFLRDDEYRDLLITTLIIIFSGTLIYHYLEDWSYLDSFYFSVVTLTTIGYGDFSPQTDGGKLFTQDGRHIKVFHFCEGIGARRTNANFRSVVEKYLNWFNPETVDFFTGICKCSNIIKERKYPKWRLEDKFEFDEYTLHIAEQAGAEVRTKAENNK